MRQLCLQIKATTNSKHNYLIVSNVYKRNFMVTKPSEVWMSEV